MPFIGKQPETGAFKLIDSITTSATATYALTVNSAAYFPESARNLIVSLNGVTQAPESAYTVSGSNIVFASALTASDVIDYILVIGDAVDIGTPSDNTVGTDQIASSVDLSGKTLTFANDQISGNVIDGGTISNFASTGIDDNASTTALTIDSSGNISVTGYIAGPSTFTIDPAAVGDNTGTLVIAGNLQVDGTTTTINSTTMTVDDLNITLASGAANAAAANGAGITVDGASASLTYDGTNDKWDFNKNVKITGTVETSSGLILAGHPVVGYSSITGGYATRLGSTGTSTLNVTQIYARGSHVATFDGATGRVGIGTTSPTNSLHVAGSGTVAFFEGTGGAGFVGIRDSDDGTIGYIGVDGGKLLFQTSGSSYSTKLAIDAAGNVGIGTTSPAVNLHVNSASDTYFLMSTSNATADNRILFRNSAGTDAGGLWYATNSNSMQFRTNSAERMRIDSSGNVGIAGAPQSFGAGVATLQLKGLSSGQATRAGALRFISNDGTSCNTAIYSDNGFMSFYTGTSTSSPERMRIDSSGSVLIGTITASPGLFRVHQTTSNQVSAYFNSVSSSTSEYGIIINLQNDPNDTTRYLMVGRGATNTDRYKVFSNGNVVNQNNSYGSISDEKLKENIIDSGSQWEDIKALRVRKYSMKADALDAPNRLGVIAQEVEAAGMSGLVINSPDLDENNNELESTTKSVNYSILYMKAVKALQEAMDRIEELEARVSVLENN